MSVKIVMLQMENIGKVKAFFLNVTQKGLTIIGGANGAGKTTVLSATAWLLGGAKFAPSKPHREGALSEPYGKLVLNNGVIVERKGKNGALSVTRADGSKGNQSMLSAMVSELALDLPRFMAGTAKEKARVLLSILGIEGPLAQLEKREKDLYQQRLTTGQIADSKKKHADELPEYADAPAEPVSVSDLLQQHNGVLAENVRRRQVRERAAQWELDLLNLQQKVLRFAEELRLAKDAVADMESRIALGKLPESELSEQSTAEIESQIADFEAINAKVAANQQKAAAHDEAANYQSQYDALTVELEGIRAERLALLEGADLPLPELTVVNGELEYKGHQWDGMSGAEQYMVSTAICRKVNPECGLVLLDKLECMDLPTLTKFCEWLELENLQAIATRVSLGDECTLIIEDGLPAGMTYADVVTLDTTTTAPPAMEDF